jgi:hypothetical protein
VHLPGLSRQGHAWHRPVVRRSHERRAPGARRARVVRVVAASAALTLWVLGAELGPSLHLAFHASLAPHTHGPVEASPASDRCHDEGAGAHCHRAPRRSTRGWDRPAEAHDAASDEGPEHGAQSIAHRAVAFLRPALPVSPVVEAPFTALAPAPWHVSLRAHARRCAPTTRGPPG